MSRNLGTDRCLTCKRQVTIKDIIGKPVEFRAYANYAPYIGTRFDCPCGAVWFVWYNRVDQFYTDDSVRENLKRGTRFAGVQYFDLLRDDGPVPVYGQLGCWSIDLSYYETFNDEPAWQDNQKPAYLVDPDDDEQMKQINKLETSRLWEEWRRVCPPHKQ